jgi:hypothetical protein
LTGCNNGNRLPVGSAKIEPTWRNRVTIAAFCRK